MAALRFIFDTCVFGKLVEEADAAELQRKIVNDKNLIVYAYQPIRKEIRKIPTKTLEQRKARQVILSAYDSIVGKHFLDDSDKILVLAKKYFSYYKSIGGTCSWGDLEVDFLIVACAAFHNLDIVCSADEKTLLSEKAKKAYNLVSIEEGFRPPTMLSYETILVRLRKD